MKDLVIQMQKERDARVLQEGLYMKRLRYRHGSC